MLSTLTKKITYSNLLLIFATILFFSCQKDLSLEDGGTVVTPPDLSTKVSSSVSGFVTDENNAAVKNATVQFGASNMTTDKYGYFEAKNVQVVKEAAVVTVNKPGYFKGIKTYMAKEGKAAFFRIKLIPKTIVGNINAAAGGVVTLSNGLSIKLPAAAVVNAATNAAYTGTVHVAAYWINPEAADLNQIMPGDLRGINTDGAIKLLQTFGMAAVELTGASGELLQIASGKKATLTLTIPSSLSATAPATIPLWYFDEAKGLWKEEGSATKTGNTYVGEVSHFSFWNVDIPGNFVQFDCTLKDPAGNPIPNVIVFIRNPATSQMGWGYTDASGFVSGAIPINAQLNLEVYPLFYCNAPVYTQAFVTTTANISLGVITLSSNFLATVSGTVTNCSNTPVTNGYVILSQGYSYSRFAVSNTGTFNFLTLLCTNNMPVTIMAHDIANLQTSNPIPYTLIVGNNAIGNLIACGNQIQEYINYSINGTNYALAAPPDNIYEAGYNSITILVVAYGSSWATLGYTRSAIPLSGNLTGFTSSYINDSMAIPTPIPINITEFGNIGQHVSGNFSGIMTSYTNPAVTYNVTCYFRTKQNY